jgi:hypothetical protein
VTIPVVDAQPYADAIEAAVTAQGVAYAEGRKPDGVPAGHPYIVGWLDAGTVGNRSMRSRDGFSLVVTLQCYGSSVDSVRFAVTRARAAVASLSGAAVGGRVLLVPSHEPSPPMDRDDDADPPIWWQSDEWRFRTSPA